MALSQQEPDLKAPRRFRRPWLRSERAVPRRIAEPLEQFLRQEAGSGALLLAAAIAALVWSNAAGDSYSEFWSTEVDLEVGPLHLEEDLRHVVNDLLMALFFYVVALEVKREFLFGSLADRVSASIPIAAALGTMVGAAATYLAINLGGGEPSGWAIPIATDIAFALAALGVAGHRAPPELRAFLLTLAVVDDLGTIIVIAVVFSEGLALAWLVGAVAVVGAIVAMQRVGVRLLAPYVVAAGALWLTVFESGVHATLAGVVLGFLTPAVSFHPREQTGGTIGKQLAGITDDPDSEMSEATMWEASRLAREAVSPLARMEEQLHPWSAFVILPLFALANAGVALSPAELGDALTGQVGLGILIGLVVGAPLGGLLFAWLAYRVGPRRLPQGLDWSAVTAVTPLKGIGFTVAIFMSVLALDDPALQDEAKLAILVGSALAGVIGLGALWARHRTIEREGRS
jgi:Na+:H+ antiporter, NhaA family